MDAKPNNGRRGFLAKLGLSAGVASVAAGLPRTADAQASARTLVSDRAAIREIVDGWIIWRDGGQWDELLRAWHPGGTMASTRFEGTAEGFLEDTKRGYAAGSKARHSQSGFWCEIAGDRAFSVTGMSIMQRGALAGVEVDVTCLGFFVDFFSFRNGRWAIDRRQPAYDRDWAYPVDPAKPAYFDPVKLAGFPAPYKHLAYIQNATGQSITMNLPEARGPTFAALMAQAHAWLRPGAA